ncbi:MAG: phytanoyl-CoA dioxygenase family protein [Pseudomonadota bacterium]
MRVSTEQRTAFARDGYLVLRGLFTPQEIASAGVAIDELAARPPSIGNEMVYFEDSVTHPAVRVLSRIERFLDRSAGLRALILDPRLTETTGELFGEPAALFKEKINFKVPGGRGFEAHQDIQPGWDAYADYFLSALVTIDPSTVANGCLELAAGHHRRGLLGEKWKPLTPAQLKGVEFRVLPTEPGDVVFFDCFVPHRSAPNLTERPRRNLYLSYNRRSAGVHREKYFMDKRAAFPPDFERAAGARYEFKV